MKLLNVCAGRVRVVEIAGESVRTAHIKAPIREPWLITADGVQGDERAVHPDKLYVFARSGYHHWARRLGIDPQAWPDGFFGENLTLDRLDEDDIRIGDVFALGAEVRLAVSGARTPCLKLAWRLGQPRTFQKLFALSRNTGAYFAVLSGGRVRPGDRLVRLEHDASMPSVAEVCAYVAGRDSPPVEPLRRLLAFAGLSPALRLLLGARLESAQRAAARAEGGWTGWRPFVVDRIVEEARDIASFHLRPRDGEPLRPARPGQFVSVRITGPGGEAVTRCWSLSDYSDAPKAYRITVRRQGGPGSKAIHRTRPGDELMLRAPAGDFVLDLGSFRPVVLIGAGIGITPLMAMLQAHLSRAEPPPIHLIHGARTPQDMVFRRELDDLAAANACLSVHHVFSRAEAEGCPPGRIDFERVRSLLADLHVVVGGHHVPLPWHEALIYMCGPDALCEELRRQFILKGGNPDQIFSERFVAPIVEACEVEAAEVRFLRSGVSCAWRAEDDLTLLEVAERAGVAVPSDCRAGACLSCRTRVLEGRATSGLGDGSALLCVGRPQTGRLVLDC